MNWYKLDEFVGESVLPVVAGFAFATVTFTLFWMAARH